jgi:2-amino-4-hydroxy-6-hydroxymethyldihydropteridine diphosphokinase
MTLVYLGLGSNMGDKEDFIKQAIMRIKKFCEITRISSIYEAEPVGNKNQDWFLNCVLEGKTDLSPKELLSACKEIEHQLGRKMVMKNGPRVIDIDILFYGNDVIKNDDLVIPHPRLHERLFVLQPMMDINPNLVHPVLKKTIKELYNQVHVESNDKVQRFKEMVFNVPLHSE